MSREAVKYLQPASLSQFDAQQRAGSVKNVELDLVLVFGLRSIRGLARYKFKGNPVFIDFAGGQVYSLVVNSRVVPSNQFYFPNKPGRIFMPGLKSKESNEVEIEFRSFFSTETENEPSGLVKQQFEEPDDFVVFSWLQPFTLHTIFPVFDQPDIKVSYSLIVGGEERMKCLFSSGGKTTKPTAQFKFPKDSQKGGTTMTRFPPWVEIFPQMQSFLWALKIPPEMLFYFANNGSNHPLAPQSFFLAYGNLSESAAHVLNPAAVTIPMVQGISKLVQNLSAAVEKYFKLPLPFSPVSLFVVHQLPGPVPRSTAGTIIVGLHNLPTNNGDLSLGVTASFCESLCGLLAEQYFGHGVSVNWWTDAVLLTSLPAFLGQEALASCRETLGFKLYSPSLLSVASKQWALELEEMDEMPKLYPVVDSIGDHGIFSLHTPGQGAVAKGVLAWRQLQIASGKLEFWATLRRVVEKNLWGLISFKELMAEFETLVKDSHSRSEFIKRWWDDWMCQRGANIMDLLWEGNTLVVKQEVFTQNENCLRMHFLSVTFIGLEGNIIGTKNFSIRASDRTKVTHDWFTQAAALIPNQDNSSYGLVCLDDHSLAYFSKNMNKVKYKFSRLQIYQCMLDMVKSYRFHPVSFCGVVLDNYDPDLPADYQDKIFTEYFWPVYSRWLTDSQFKSISQRFFRLIMDEFSAGKLVGVLQTYLIRTCCNREDISYLQTLDEKMQKANTSGRLEFGMTVLLKIYESEEFAEPEKESLFFKYVEICSAQSRTDLVELLQSLVDFLGKSPVLKREFLFSKIQEQLQQQEQEKTAAVGVQVAKGTKGGVKTGKTSIESPSKVGKLTDGQGQSKTSSGFDLDDSFEERIELAKSLQEARARKLMLAQDEKSDEWKGKAKLITNPRVKPNPLTGILSEYLELFRDIPETVFEEEIDELGAYFEQNMRTHFEHFYKYLYRSTFPRTNRPSQLMMYLERGMKDLENKPKKVQIWAKELLLDMKRAAEWQNKFPENPPNQQTPSQDGQVGDYYEQADGQYQDQNNVQNDQQGNYEDQAQDQDPDQAGEYNGEEEQYYDDPNYPQEGYDDGEDHPNNQEHYSDYYERDPNAPLPKNERAMIFDGERMMSEDQPNQPTDGSQRQDSKNAGSPGPQYPPNQLPSSQRKKGMIQRNF